ncbi:MAG: methyltransferase [Candidatus Dormibacteraeota bacterium]|nr:methyltransferase [Candidatus Dormibacteraeota bacterium]
MSIPKKRPPLATPKQGHYFDPAPEAESKRRTLHLRLPDLDIELQADRGVFGSRAIDLGTLTLLKEAPLPPPEGDLLDLGCGYGPIAVALARRSPRAKVWAVDVNERALQLTRVNAATAKTANVTVSLPDGVPPDVRFTSIYSNPPVRVGKAPLHDLLQRWLPRLAPGASAYLVVQRNLGADSLASWLAAQGFSVRRLKSKKGYRVLSVANGEVDESAEAGHATPILTRDPASN